MGHPPAPRSPRGSAPRPCPPVSGLLSLSEVLDELPTQVSRRSTTWAGSSDQRPSRVPTLWVAGSWRTRLEAMAYQFGPSEFTQLQGSASTQWLVMQAYANGLANG